MKRDMLLLFVLLLPQGQRSWAQEVKERATLKGHTGVICSLAFTPDGKTLASGSSDGTIRLWGIPGGAPCAGEKIRVRMQQAST